MAKLSNDYILRETLRHMQRCIDTSVAKTIARIPQLEDDQSKKEVFFALSNLGKLSTLLSQIKQENAELLGLKNEAST
jgi:hypothetical protein